MALNSSGRSDRDFLMSMIMLILCLISFFFSLYLLPFLIWNLNYDIPGFIFVWQEELKQVYNYTAQGAAAIIFLVFFIPSLLLGYLSKLFATELIKDDTLSLEEPKVNQEQQERAAQQRRETLQFGLKLFLMVILVYIVLSLIEWLVAIPPPV